MFELGIPGVLPAIVCGRVRLVVVGHCPYQQAVGNTPLEIHVVAGTVIDFTKWLNVRILLLKYAAGLNLR